MTYFVDAEEARKRFNECQLSKGEMFIPIVNILVSKAIELGLTQFSVAIRPEVEGSFVRLLNDAGYHVEVITDIEKHDQIVILLVSF